MFNIKKQLPNGKEFTERAKYIFDWSNSHTYINNAEKKSIVDRTYKGDK